MKNIFNKNSSSAITLISLVITIIVLLILAGVSLNISINNSDLINKTASTVKNQDYITVFEELQSIILAAQTEDIRNESNLKSVVKYLLNDSQNDYTISSKSKIDDPDNIGDIDSESQITPDTNEIFIIFKDKEIKLDKDLKLHKIED